MSKKRKLILLLSMLISNAAFTQDSLGTHVYYDVSAEALVGMGDYSAYQLTTNRHSDVGIRSNSANMRAAVGLEHSFSDKYVLSGKIDAIASVHADHKAYLQQCYLNMKLNHFFVEAGARDIAPVLRDPRLSSGALVESGNAKPIPQVRFGTDGFWTVPYTRNFLEVYVDCAYGRYLDNSYVEDKAWEHFNKTGKGIYVTDKLFHHKQLYIRSNSSKPVFFMVGIDHVVQFGGAKTGIGLTEGYVKYSNGLKDYFKVIIPQSDSNTGEWISGNHIGTMTFQAGWNITPEHQLQVYLDNIFEDGSGIRKGNGMDGLWGIEYRNKAKGLHAVKSVVCEFLRTVYQSGYIHWDPNDYEYPYNSISDMQDLITGNDDYYNNTTYQSYSYFGMAQGNALLTSPIYNKDDENVFKDNMVNAFHLGVEGDIYKGPQGYIGYLFRGSYREGKGTHVVLLDKKSHSFSAMMQLDWMKGPWKGSVAYGLDRGNTYGNNNTVNLKISYHGKIL